MDYLLFEEYQQMGGSAEESAFSVLERKAEMKIDFLTNGRLKHDTDFPDAVKLTVFEIISLLQQKEQYDTPESGVVSSVSNDGVSVSYANQSASEFLETFDKKVASIMRENLFDEKNQDGEPLLYRGW